jgi:putative transposase
VERRSGVVMTMRSKFSPREIVQRLQMIETLTAEGLPVAEALRSVGMREAEYNRWRVEYNGLGRTLGPLLCATPKLTKRTRRTVSARKPAK